MEIYSARQLCSMFPNKYIVVRVLEKDKIDTEILKAELIKVYDTLDECKRHTSELKRFMSQYGEELDVIFGDYDEYKKTRCVIDAFRALGWIALEMFGAKWEDGD